MKPYHILMIFLFCKAFTNIIFPSEQRSISHHEFKTILMNKFDQALELTTMSNPKNASGTTMKEHLESLKKSSLARFKTLDKQDRSSFHKQIDYLQKVEWHLDDRIEQLRPKESGKHQGASHPPQQSQPKEIDMDKIAEEVYQKPKPPLQEQEAYLAK